MHSNITSDIVVSIKQFLESNLYTKSLMDVLQETLPMLLWIGLAMTLFMVLIVFLFDYYFGYYGRIESGIRQRTIVDNKLIDKTKVFNKFYIGKLDKTIVLDI